MSTLSTSILPLPTAGAGAGAGAGAAASTGAAGGAPYSFWSSARYPSKFPAKPAQSAALESSAASGAVVVSFISGVGGATVKLQSASPLQPKLCLARFLVPTPICHRVAAHQLASPPTSASNRRPLLSK